MDPTNPERATGDRHIRVDLTGGTRPVSAEAGDEIKGGDWFALFLLGAYLHALGLPAEFHEDPPALDLGFGDAVCRARVDDGYDGATPVVPLWFEVTLPREGIVVEESMAAPANLQIPIEDRTIRSYHDAIHLFADGSLATIRRLYEPVANDHVTEGTARSWAAGAEHRWRVLFGPGQLLLASPDSEQEARRFLETNRLITGVMDPVASLLRSPKLHWCSVFVYRPPTGEAFARVRLDGMSYTQADDTARHIELPGSGALGLRQFALFKPELR